MAVYDVDIKSPAQGARVTPRFTVEVEVGRDDQEPIMVLVAVEPTPPVDVDALWDESSKGYWLVCTPHSRDGRFKFSCTVDRRAGAYFVRARASVSGNPWCEWKADEQRITITVRATS
jgi:hypothetical protein